MTSPVPIAFYAPLKSPHHPEPSGDRTVARLLLRALAAAGFPPEIASERRSFEPSGDSIRQEEIRREGQAEAETIAARWLARPPGARPRLWVTYHCYYKAPDWTGPRAATRLGIPYAVVEGSRASKRAGGPWAIGHAGAEAALDRADLLFVVTEQDREALARARPPRQRLVALPPFLDLADWPPPPPQAARPAGAPLRLLAVAMMRPGDKLDSYRLLAEALGLLSVSLAWRLDIVGDGPARFQVEDLFSPWGDRVAFRGQADGPSELAGHHAAADLFVWPAVREAYGMAFLEAQSQGLPVLAGRHGGVSDVVREGHSAVLVPPGDDFAARFAAVIAAFAADPAQLAAMGRSARAFAAERDLGGAAAILRTALLPLLAREAA